MKNSYILFLLVFFLSVGCDDASDSKIPGIEYDTDIYSTGIENEDDIIRTSEGFLVVKNHVLVVMNADDDINGMITDVEAVDATLIGKIPVFGVYEFRVDTSNENELFEKIDEISSLGSVDSVIPDYVSEGYDYTDDSETKNYKSTVAKFPCSPATDIDKKFFESLSSFCNYMDTEYYQTTALLKLLESRLNFSLSTVNVGVADGTFYKIEEEMKNLKFFNKSVSKEKVEFVISDRNFMDKVITNTWNTSEILKTMDATEIPVSGDEKYDEYLKYTHGSVIMEILAADMNGTFPNGLLRAYLKDNFNIYYAPTQSDVSGILTLNTLSSKLASMGSLLKKIKNAPVNASIFFAFKKSNLITGEKTAFTAIYNRLTTLLKKNNLLLVVAAPHNKGIPEEIDISSLEFFPFLRPDSIITGIDKSRIITVGGAKSITSNNQCDLSVWTGNINTLKAGIDIYAPAYQIDFPIIGTQGTYFVGTSFSAPYVTAAAALLFSINKNISSESVKRYLKDYPRSVTINNTYTFPMLSFSYPLLYLLWDMNCSADPTLDKCKYLSVADGDTRLGPIESGFIIARTCEETSMRFEVEQIGDLIFDSTDEVGILGNNWIPGDLPIDIEIPENPVGFQYTGHIDENTLLEINCSEIKAPLENLPLRDTSSSTPGCTVVFKTQNGEDIISGYSISGSFSFDTCELTDTMSNFSGSLAGTVKMGISASGVMNVSSCNNGSCTMEDVPLIFNATGFFPTYVQVYTEPELANHLNEICN
ncbi:MAG: S8/S53 family peptidase [Deltaproteobacteria bacterium]|nr:S8/S53 family peptidase [Deltaproteobacteria bacterium]